MKKKISLIMAILAILVAGIYILSLESKEPQIEQSQVAETTPVALTNEDAWYNYNGAEIGRIYTDDTTIDSPLIQATQSGTDNASMDMGIAHDPTTSLPGENGPIVASGHRETYAGGLYDLEVGDSVNVDILDQTYNYKVTDAYMITNDEASTIFNQTDDKLILYTCYPPEENTPVTGRWVVEAELI